MHAIFDSCKLMILLFVKLADIADSNDCGTSSLLDVHE